MLSDLAPLRSWSVRHDRADRLTRLDVPAGLRTDLGCDAVGIPARHGFRLLGRIPGAGCVFADGAWWWWILPAGSDQDLTWPLPSHYAPGARVPAADARLIHRPEGSSPYTPPIPLYLMLCQLTGTQPRWPAGVGGPGRETV